MTTDHFKLLTGKYKEKLTPEQLLEIYEACAFYHIALSEGTEESFSYKFSDLVTECIFESFKKDLKNIHDVKSQNGKNGGRPAIPEEKKENIMKDLEAGFPVSKVAENNGVSERSVYNCKNTAKTAKSEKTNISESNINKDKVKVSEVKEVYAPHCTTSLSQNIKNTTLLYGFTLSPGQTKSFLEKTESFTGDLACLTNFIIKRTMEKYENKPSDEMIRLYINALTKYPEEFLEEFYAADRTEQKRKDKDSLRLKYFNPPSTKCTCGHEMQERSDTDEKTGIDYMAYKCPSCNTMLTCEEGKWAYSQGAPEFSVVAV